MVVPHLGLGRNRPNICSYTVGQFPKARLDEQFEAIHQEVIVLA